MEKQSSLFKALLKFSGYNVSLKKNSKNPFFKSDYADLSEVIDKTRQPLFECGLFISSHVQNGELITRLCHEDGEFQEARFALPQTQDIQKMGSAITYARRYQIVALLNLIADTDDDGNVAAVSAVTSKPQPLASPKNLSEKLKELSFDDFEAKCKNLHHQKKYLQYKKDFEACFSYFGVLEVMQDGTLLTQARIDALHAEALEKK